MKYPFTVFQSETDNHVFWIAKSTLLKGCVGQGDTSDEALKELSENEESWLEAATEFGIPVPEIPVDNLDKYSGKMTLRVSPIVHRTASMMAKREGISLNQYISDAIIAKNSMI